MPRVVASDVALLFSTKLKKGGCLSIAVFAPSPLNFNFNTNLRPWLHYNLNSKMRESFDLGLRRVQLDLV